MVQAINVYPHEIGRDLIPELATRVYSSELDSFREAVSNSFDENSRRVELTITRDKIVIEDWGNGIKNFNEFRKFGQASKKSRAGEVIGEKGLGKLSLLNLGDLVCFETNNQKIGIRFYMNMSGFSKPVFGKSNSFISHKGTRITITRLTNKIEVNSIVNYLRKAFGLRLAQDAKIIVNSQRIKPKSTLDPDETLLFTLPKSDTPVTGNLKSDKEGKGLVDVYIDHVFVANIDVDTRRSFGGWVNCNNLTPETSRNNIIQNEAYCEFMACLGKYVSRFPLKDSATIDQHKLLLGKELNTLLKNYIKDMKINVNNTNNNHVNNLGSTNSKLTEKRRKHANTLQVSESRKSSNSHLIEQKSNDSSIRVRWEYADLGNEKEPIYFVSPNTIYCNTSNDLFQFAMMKSRYYGPTWVRILPYLARIAVEMNPESSRLPIDQFNLRVDEATRYFLKQKKAITH